MVSSGFVLVFSLKVCLGVQHLFRVSLGVVKAQFKVSLGLVWGILMFGLGIKAWINVFWCWFRVNVWSCQGLAGGALGLHQGFSRDSLLTLLLPKAFLISFQACNVTDSLLLTLCFSIMVSCLLCWCAVVTGFLLQGSRLRHLGRRAGVTDSDSAQSILA